jgi:simple sugar transport system permease protein
MQSAERASAEGQRPKPVVVAGRKPVRSEIGVIIGIVVVWAVFYLLSPKFLWISNLGNIFTAAAVMGIIAVGMAFLIIAGEFDLSVGAVSTVVPIIMLKLSQGLHVPLIVGFAAGMVVAGLIGFANGYVTLRLKLPSFIVTLASMLLLSGTILAITGGFLTDHIGPKPPLFLAFAARFGAFSVSTIWMLAVVAVFAFILDYTRYGNWVYAVGGNREVAEKLGIKVARVKITNFVICALLAGFAGCVGVARISSVNPAADFDLMFNAMAGGIIGGCLISGGRGSIIGTLLGVILLTSVNSGLILAGASPYWYRAFVGAIVLAVVIINLVVGKKVRK